MACLSKRFSVSKYGFYSQIVGHCTQAGANKAAKQFVVNSGGGEARINIFNGRIRDSGTVFLGNDFNPPRDTKY